MGQLEQALGQAVGGAGAWADVEARCFPVFTTLSKFLELLDACLEQPFFGKEDEEEDDEAVDAGGEGPAGRAGRRARTARGSRRRVKVTFQRFLHEYWPHMPQTATRDLLPGLVYTEILSRIKGSLTSAQQGRALRLDEYLEVLRRGAERAESASTTLSQQQGRQIYDLFQHYKRRMADVHPDHWDDADVALHIHSEMACGRYRGGWPTLHRVYIDEVQDLLEVRDTRRSLATWVRVP
jgi:hypothetical protein